MNQLRTWAAGDEPAPCPFPAGRELVDAALGRDLLTAHFQPIYSARDGSVFGYEALARLRGGEWRGDIGELFNAARQCGAIARLDRVCRENAVKTAKLAGIGPGMNLFVNVCPLSITNAEADVDRFDGFAAQWGLAPGMTVIEIVEDVALASHAEALRAFSLFKRKGYRIALDDFGSGYAGLSTLAAIMPDFVKINRTLVSGMDRAPAQRAFVEAIVAACHRCGVKTVAEGLERAGEVDIARDLGVELLQGFYLGRPAPSLARLPAPLRPTIRHAAAPDGARPGPELVFIGEIARQVDTISPFAPVTKAFSVFNANPELKSLPVVEDSRVFGLLQRSGFFENHLLGKFGYGMHLNKRKTVGQLVAPDFFIVEASTPLEEVSQRIQSRRHEYIYDDICVTDKGLYAGTVAVIRLLDVMTEKSIHYARGANPLTGMPGNEFIHREVDKRLALREPFDVCYLDLDNFKPFNDQCGFDRGDAAIRALAEIIQQAVAEHGQGASFAGHIGGDDFIVIALPRDSGKLCARIIAAFREKLPELHGPADYQRGYYCSLNRKGKSKAFPLLSISIAIVGARGAEGESYASIASISAEVKKAAKAVKGSVVIRNRRSE